MGGFYVEAAVDFRPLERCWKVRNMTEMTVCKTGRFLHRILKHAAHNIYFIFSTLMEEGLSSGAHMG